MKIRIVQIGLPLSLVGFFWMASAGFGAADSFAAADKNLAAEIAALKSQIAQIASQIQNSQDYIAINNLQDAYGYYVDKTKWDEVADLFTDDGSVEIGLRGVYKGKERVRAYMHHLGDLKYGTLFNHSQLQPVVHIDLDGLHAHGRFRAYMQVGTLNSRAQWGDAVYENEYVKENGVWKIKKLHAYFTYYVNYYKGWDQGGDPPPGPIPGLPPDEPPTETYKLYPDIYIPPYHYKNPVTGR
ncbi:MAG: nuclear transport factor 2 family protein [Candidatus Acidoferrales bacterium]|nr:nuclear transport factor 2 family protein [Candidatus Acidoferrales bacterium]